MVVGVPVAEIRKKVGERFLAHGIPVEVRQVRGGEVVLAVPADADVVDRPEDLEFPEVDGWDDEHA